MRYYRSLLIASLGLLTSCAVSAAGESKPRLAAFHSSNGTIQIDENHLVVQLRNKRAEFESCSTADNYCYRSNDGMIILPKKCPRSLVNFYNADPNFKVIGYVHDIITVKFSKSEKIMFSYSIPAGLTAIYYDSEESGALSDRGGGLGVDRVAAQRYAFLPKRRTATLTCKEI